ncbi:PREDICTED: uncharacterized protein LOC101375159 [Odobenus rosmarus divergens]|uniref:Uncharacterized protein LOC101375159 n=1 Tax=Odobenus rosmarus divergens TaxID=9708 RepID=A0A9B0HE07_ODORO
MDRKAAATDEGAGGATTRLPQVAGRWSSGAHRWRPAPSRGCGPGGCMRTKLWGLAASGGRGRGLNGLGGMEPRPHAQDADRPREPNSGLAVGVAAAGLAPAPAGASPPMHLLRGGVCDWTLVIFFADTSQAIPGRSLLSQTSCSPSHQFPWEHAAGTGEFKPSVSRGCPPATRKPLPAPSYSHRGKALKSSAGAPITATWLSTWLSPLSPPEALQSELEPVNKEASRSYAWLRLRFCQRRQRHLEHLSALIRDIPGFWAKAILNHPKISAVTGDQDRDVVSYMTNLEVEELSHSKYHCRLMFSFENNPYFQNKVIIKEYHLSIAGYGPSQSTPIQWHQDYERESYSHRHHNPSLSFFNWFSAHSFAGSSRIAEVGPCDKQREGPRWAPRLLEMGL